MQTKFPRIFGNIQNRQRISDAIINGTLAHAYIMEGAEGSGKRTFAREIAAALACQNRNKSGFPLPCGVCSSCVKIAGENSADVTYLAPEGASISVDAIRAMRSDMYLSSSEEEKKVYIIDKAETLTPQAQNALLIVLEEPPTDSLIFLLTDRADSLLPTIRSRASTIRMHLLSKEEMVNALKTFPAWETFRYKSEAERLALLESASGRLGVLLELLDGRRGEELMQERDLALKVATVLIKNVPFKDRFAMQQSMPTKRGELAPFLDLVTTVVRDCILFSRDETCNLCFFTDREALQQTIEGVSLTRLLKVADLLTETKGALDINANVAITVQHLFASCV